MVGWGGGSVCGVWGSGGVWESGMCMVWWGGAGVQVAKRHNAVQVCKGGGGEEGLAMSHMSNKGKAWEGVSPCLPPGMSNGGRGQGSVVGARGPGLSRSCPDPVPVLSCLLCQKLSVPNMRERVEALEKR